MPNDKKWTVSVFIVKPFLLEEHLFCVLLTGIKVSNSTFNALVMRYADQKGRIEFDDFIHCAIRLKSMFGKLCILKFVMHKGLRPKFNV